MLAGPRRATTRVVLLDTCVGRRGVLAPIRQLGLAHLGDHTELLQHAHLIPVTVMPHELPIGDQSAVWSAQCAVQGRPRTYDR